LSSLKAHTVLVKSQGKPWSIPMSGVTTCRFSYLDSAMFMDGMITILVEWNG